MVSERIRIQDIRLCRSSGCSKRACAGTKIIIEFSVLIRKKHTWIYDMISYIIKAESSCQKRIFRKKMRSICDSQIFAIFSPDNIIFPPKSRYFPKLSVSVLVRVFTESSSLTKRIFLIPKYLSISPKVRSARELIFGRVIHVC